MDRVTSEQLLTNVNMDIYKVTSQICCTYIGAVSPGQQDNCKLQKTSMSTASFKRTLNELRASQCQQTNCKLHKLQSLGVSQTSHFAMSFGFYVSLQNVHLKQLLYVTARKCKLRQKPVIRAHLAHINTASKYKTLLSHHSTRIHHKHHVGHQSTTVQTWSSVNVLFDVGVFWEQTTFTSVCMSRHIQVVLVFQVLPWLLPTEQQTSMLTTYTTSCRGNCIQTASKKMSLTV